MLSFIALLISLNTSVCYQQQDADSLTYFQSEEVNFSKSIQEQNFTFGEEDIIRSPQKDLTDIISSMPGMLMKDNKLHFQGSESDEIEYLLNGFSVRDPFTGNIVFRIPKQVLSKIILTSGDLSNKYNTNRSSVVFARLKSGHDKFEFGIEGITDNLTFKNGQNFFDGNQFLGTHSYGYNELNTSLGGALFNSEFSYFLNLNYLFQRDRSPEFYEGINAGIRYEYLRDNPSEPFGSVNIFLPPGPVKGNSEEDFSLMGNFIYTKGSTKISLLALLSKNRNDISQYPWASISNTRVGIITKDYFLCGLEISRNISKNFSATIKAGYSQNNSKTFDPYLKDDIWKYGDYYANKNAGLGWQAKNYYGLDTTQFSFPSDIDVDNFRFPRQNYTDVIYQKKETNKLSLEAYLNYKPLENVIIHFGGKFDFYTHRQWKLYTPTIYLASNLNSYFTTPTQYTIEEAKNYLLDNYYVVDVLGYKVSGEESNGSGLYAPGKSVIGSVFNDYHYNWDKGSLSFRFQYDYFDMDTWKLNSLDYFFYFIQIDEDNFTNYYEKVKKRHYFSPRISINQQITPSTALIFSAGKYVHQQPFSNIYMGYNRFVYERNRSHSYPHMINPGAEPKTIYDFQLGLNFYFANSQFSIHGFSRNSLNGIYDLVPSADSLRNPGYQNSDPMGVNGKQTISRGLTANAKIISGNSTFRANLTYQSVKSDESYQSVYDYPGTGLIDFVPAYHGSNFFGNLIYTFRSGENVSVDFLKNISFTTQLIFNNGFPYALNPQLSNDPRNVYFNTQNTPWSYRIDVFLSKKINLLENANAEIFLSVINLFNRKNVESVYENTGQPDNNNLPEELIGNSEFHRELTIGYNGYYSEPRQIQAGIRINL